MKGEGAKAGVGHSLGNATTNLRIKRMRVFIIRSILKPVVVLSAETRSNAQEKGHVGVGDASS